MNAECDSVYTDVYAFGFIIGLLGDVIDSDDMSELGNCCQDFEPDKRPNVDAIINYLNRIKLLELVIPTCRPLNRASLILAGYCSNT